MSPRFTKFHGYGNDYLVFEAEQLAGIGELGRFAKGVCNRHYGAGADGIAVVQKSEPPAVAGGQLNADFSVRIFNPDGSEASMSGNGTRCVASYLFFHNLWTKDQLRLQTRNGVKRYLLRERLGDGAFLFQSELRQPRFDSASIPMLTDEPLDRVIDYSLQVGNETLRVTALQMGNPNCCVFVDDFDKIDWRRLGPLIENHPQFPERTNVIFVRVRDRGNIEERLWERGVGETESSGTCSCAAVIASVIKEKTDRQVNVPAPRGGIPIEWRGDREGVPNAPAALGFTAGGAG